MGVPEGRWTVRRGYRERTSVIVRFRDVPAGGARAELPVRINVTWAIAVADAEGFPAPVESALLIPFEDRLIAAVERRNIGVLLAVVTGGGRRDFLLQVTDRDRFIDALKQMPHEALPYPLTIVEAQDPSWEYYEALTRT